MEGLPKTAVILAACMLCAPLVSCLNVTSSPALKNEAVSPTQDSPPSTPSVTSVSLVPSMTGGSWFFWSRPAAGNGSVNAAETTAPASAVNASKNVAGTQESSTTGTWSFWRRSVRDNGTVNMTENSVPDSPVNISTNLTGAAASPVTRSAEASTVQPTLKFATDGLHTTKNFTSRTPVADSPVTTSAESSTLKPTSKSATDGSPTTKNFTHQTQAADSLVTRAAVASTMKSTLQLAMDNSSASTLSPAQSGAYVVVAGPKHSDCSNKTESTTAVFADFVRDRAGPNSDMTGTPSTTGSVTGFQSLDAPPSTQVPATSSAPKAAEATSDGSCHCHDTPTPSTAVHSVALEQQAHVTHPPADTSAASVAATSTGGRPALPPQTPPKTATVPPHDIV